MYKQIPYMKSLDDLLDNLKQKYIDINPIEEEVYNKHFQQLSDSFFALLRNEDPVLKTLYGGCSLQGSSGDKLKVGQQNEFDMVFYLEFPHIQDQIVLPDMEMPGNVYLNMTRVLNHLEPENGPIYRLLITLVNDQNLLVVSKLQSWLQSSVSRVLNKMQFQFKFDKTVCHLKYRRCGPAHTIYVEGDFKYSVDFVPAVRLRAEETVLEGDRLLYFKEQKYWEAIPKPMKPFRAESTSFRASYYDAERVMLKDRMNCKMAIKFIKKYRDVKTNLSNLKSYYIKNLFLLKIAENPESFEDKSLAVILIEMFEELETRLRAEELPFFWDPKLNMLNLLSSEQIKEMFICVEGTSKYLRSIAQSPIVEERFLLHFFSKKTERRTSADKHWSKPRRLIPISKPCDNHNQRLMMALVFSFTLILHVLILINLFS